MPNVAATRVEGLEKSELAHHGHLIPLLPPLDDASVLDAVEYQAIDMYATLSPLTI